MTDEMKQRAKAAQREYLRQWRRENKEKVREYNIQYWARKADRGLNKEERNASD